MEDASLPLLREPGGVDFQLLQDPLRQALVAVGPGSREGAIVALGVEGLHGRGVDDAHVDLPRL